jgi:hypothetical protein
MKLAIESKCEQIDDRPISNWPPLGNYRIQSCNLKEFKGRKTNNAKIRFYWDVLFPNGAKVRCRVWKDYPTGSFTVKDLP